MIFVHSLVKLETRNLINMQTKDVGPCRNYANCNAYAFIK